VRASTRTIGRYEVLREIGRGGMATVYVARQVDLDRRVALKELRALGMLDPTSARRFLREARLAGSLSHPNIVTVHEHFEHDGVPYIAMEYLAPGSLRPYIGRLTPSQIAGVLEGLLAGLAHAERHEVVHRDIKPENLLVTLDGGIKIADFGIAKATGALEARSMLTAIGTTVGTPNYIAPEQAMAGHLGPWTDLYAVGVTAFELLVGRTPFGDTEEPLGIVLRQINEPLPRVSDLVPNLDPRISDWVGWLGAKSPADRPQSAAQAWDALDEVLLTILGPRWRREGPLPTAMGERAAPDGRPPLGFLAAGAAGAAVAAGPAGAAIAPTLAPAWSGPTERRVGERLLAPTTAPLSHPEQRIPPAAGTRRSRRIPTALKVASILAILFAVGAAMLNPRHGSTLAPAGEGSTLTGSTPAATESTATGPATPPPGAAGASLAEQVEPARQLASTYDDAATRITKRSPGGALSPADAALVGALRATATSYRAAAAAATRGDLAAYTAALTSAAAGRREVSGLLDGAQGPSGPSAVPAPTPTAKPTTSSCAGDSTSDDPSDDACGE
jgi:tRNA A-37 threonylcarbamoyl transferase component Bud32